MKIVQIIPADGWHAIHFYKYKQQFEAEPLACWALVTPEDSTPPIAGEELIDQPEVIGLQTEDRFLVFPNKETFIHYCTKEEAEKYPQNQ